MKKYKINIINGNLILEDLIIKSLLVDLDNFINEL